MDNYQFVERLGQGSFAVVWKARRKSDYRVVAVKQLRQAPTTWEECKRLPEIRAAAAARGPHIIALLEAVRHGNELCLIFEYADSDLLRCLGPSRRCDEPQVRWAMRQVLAALATIHAAGLVHCDVKPENMLLLQTRGNEPVLKLCDLGQAAAAGEVTDYVGTRWYRAPELLLGESGAGGEIDLWAAGCAMSELLLMRPTFPGADTRDMLFRICSEIGPPDDDWHLSERLMESSGLRIAPNAAEGPIWAELAAAGASASAVDLARCLLRYDPPRRAPASRCLHQSFFGSALPEAPIVPHEFDNRAKSAEHMQRSRQEAKAIQRKLQTNGAVGGHLARPTNFAAPALLQGTSDVPALSRCAEKPLAPLAMRAAVGPNSRLIQRISSSPGQMAASAMNRNMSFAGALVDIPSTEGALPMSASRSTSRLGVAHFGGITSSSPCPSSSETCEHTTSIRMPNSSVPPINCLRRSGSSPVLPSQRVAGRRIHRPQLENDDGRAIDVASCCQALLSESPQHEPCL